MGRLTKGEIIKGYKILQEPFRRGESIWTFAEKDGVVFFIKEFLTPKYPVSSDRYTPPDDVKASLLKECLDFERRHQSIMKALQSRNILSGNLIIPVDFFRDGPQYYKVTEKVDTSTIDITAIADLTLDEQVLIMRTVAHSIRVLHRLNIVHGDIKPENILLKRSSTGKLIAKLIDFDSGYFVGSPPPPEQMVGDYYSPEQIAYIDSDDDESKRAAASHLTTASDIFSLGVVYYQYFVGEFLDYEDSDVVAKVPEAFKRKGIPKHLATLIQKMLQKDWRHRPKIDDVFRQLRVSGSPDEDSNHILKGLSPKVSVSSHGNTPETKLKGTLLK